LDDRKRGAVLRTVMLAVRRSSVRDRARMAPSYLIIEVARLVEARSIALSIAEPPRWTPGTAVAVPLHEAERHRCIAMRSGTPARRYELVATKGRTIDVSLFPSQSGRSKSQACNDRASPCRLPTLLAKRCLGQRQLAFVRADVRALLVLHGFAQEWRGWIPTGVWHGGSQYPSRSHAFGHPGLQNAPCA
jgi:hypothetical protein